MAGAAGKKIFHSELSESMPHFLATNLSISTKNGAMILPTAILVPEKKFQRLEPTGATATRLLSSLVLTH
jgi:hypothetical protein